MNSKLGLKEKIGYGIGAVSKDMVYMLSATYVLYYYQDLLHINAVAMGIILLIARVFDAFNDPIMGIVVAKTKSKWGKFRPWLFSGTVLNALFLYGLFAAPTSFKGNTLVIYAAIVYILWGMTYTMMDIPFWSMIPAFTKAGKERENMSALGRSCAGVGSAIMQIFTMMAVYALGHNNEIVGFKYLALIIAIIFIVFELITCLTIKETSTVNVKSPSVKEMFTSLLKNDQALVVVVTIILVNISVYITSNLVIYFFKYDFGGQYWFSSYTLFNTFGGACQILSMMILFPLLRKYMNTQKIFNVALYSAILGYIVLLLIAFTSMSNVYILFIPAFLIFCANGLLLVLTTIFLSNTVDYGQYKNNSRDESVIFSMQTFVVKLSSGIAALVAALTLAIFNFGSSSQSGKIVKMASSSIYGLRVVMTILPMIGLLFAIYFFRKKYILTDEKMEEITNALKGDNL